MKKILSNKLLSYHLLLTLVLFSCFNMVKEIIPFDGGSDELYGFPLSYITGNLGCTGCYELYIAPMIFDLLLYFVAVTIVLKGIEMLGLKLRSHWVAGLVSLILSSLIIFLFFAVPDTLSYRLYNPDPYKTISERFIYF